MQSTMRDEGKSFKGERGRKGHNLGRKSKKEWGSFQRVRKAWEEGESGVKGK